MGLVEISGLKVYAYHGVHEVENIVGQWYVVDLSLSVDFTEAQENDKLSGTIDYSKVNDMILSEMKINSKLIEHVAGRIKTSLQNQFTMLKSGSIKISKLNPPVKGAVNAVAVTVTF
ncbi:MAG: dihydroneopterin aldolase [Saprospiraceae bacterium]|jgi:dihydroneopterin aldolase